MRLRSSEGIAGFARDMNVPIPLSKRPNPGSLSIPVKVPVHEFGTAARCVAAAFTIGSAAGEPKAPVRRTLQPRQLA